MRVKKLPLILALHLKRFKYVEQYNRHIKVSHRVVFPLELRLFNTVCIFTNGNSLKLILNMVAVGWRGKPWPIVRPGGCRGSLRIGSQSRPLHFYREESRLLVVIRWWHCRCKFIISSWKNRKIPHFGTCCRFFLLLCRKLIRQL